MANRIPSSLKWLVDKRRRIHSEIIFLEEKVSKRIAAQQARLLKLGADLQAVDATIQLHEILIDPSKITPVRVYRDRSDFKYGEMTRLIYSFLAEAQSTGLTTNQVADLMIAKRLCQLAVNRFGVYFFLRCESIVFVNAITNYYINSAKI